MRLLVRHFDGSLQAAILIAMCGGYLRVSVPGYDDAVEIRWADGQWLAENGEVVKLQFDPAPEEFYGCVRQAAEARQVALPARMLECWAAHGPQMPSAEPVN
jgi:hypothetical protein